MEWAPVNFTYYVHEKALSQELHGRLKEFVPDKAEELQKAATCTNISPLMIPNGAQNGMKS